MLVLAKADLTIQNNEGKTALDLALTRGGPTDPCSRALGTQEQLAAYQAKIEGLLAKAEKAAADGEWLKSKEYCTQALKLDQNNQGLKDRLSDAQDAFLNAWAVGLKATQEANAAAKKQRPADAERKSLWQPVIKNDVAECLRLLSTGVGPNDFEEVDSVSLLGKLHCNCHAIDRVLTPPPSLVPCIPVLICLLLHAVAHQDDGFPLMVACDNGSVDVVQLLIEHNADVNANWRGTAAESAMRRGKPEALRVLLAAGVDIESVRDFIRYNCGILPQYARAEFEALILRWSPAHQSR